jgi:hypothetical protein
MGCEVIMDRKLVKIIALITVIAFFATSIVSIGISLFMGR